MSTTLHPTQKPQLGVSACLIGQAVRYDGTDKHEPLLTAHIARYCDLIPFCPEVAIGLGVPRETIALVDHPQHPQAIGTQTLGHNVTVPLQGYAQTLAPQLRTLSGYIVKTRSPSCGWQGVKIYRTLDTPPIATGRGIFIAEVHRLLPLLPVIDEEQLRLADYRQAFFERVYALLRWQYLGLGGWTPHKLMLFHSQYKYLIMSRKDLYYRQLGRLVAQAQRNDSQRISLSYISQLMHILAETPTRASHSQALQHLIGYFKKQLSTAQKQQWQQSLAAYRNGELPLSTLVATLKDHLNAFPNAYLAQQAYLFPYPQGL